MLQAMDSYQADKIENRDVFVNRVPVELYKIIKFENLASSGGEAKHMIAEGQVRLNGQVEFQKRKKVYPGDEIRVENLCLRIIQEEG